MIIGLTLAVFNLFGLTIVDAQQEVVGIAIDTNGNVGVGTESPTKTLHVEGDSYTKGILYGNGYGGLYGNAVILEASSATGNDMQAVIHIDDTVDPPLQPITIYGIDPQDPNNSSGYKTFVIPHPINESKYLVHATLEGPEGAVYYRGSSRLKNGRAEIHLPSYFEALTKLKGRTIQLTNVGGFDRLAVELQNEERIKGGKFVVISDNPDSTQNFDWEVKATRNDREKLEVEPNRAAVTVSGLGPYTFAYPRNDMKLSKILKGER